MTATEALLPCPFCGGTDIDLSEGSTYRWRYVGCAGCGAQLEFRSDNRFAPTVDTWKDAAETWNRRHARTEAGERYTTPGYALAMRVLQSDLYEILDGSERTECDEMIRRGQAAPATRQEDVAEIVRKACAKACDEEGAEAKVIALSKPTGQRKAWYDWESSAKSCAAAIRALDLTALLAGRKL